MLWFKRSFSGIFLFFLFFLVGEMSVVHAQQEEYLRGTVEEVVQEHTSEQDTEGKLLWQELLIRLSDSGVIVPVSFGSEFQPLDKEQLLSAGESVVMVTSQNDVGETIYSVQDVYRLRPLFFLLVLSVLAVVAVARWQGVRSLIGMVITLLSLNFFLLPALLNGNDPLLVTLIWASGIGLITLYLTHGFTFHSHIALLSLIMVMFLVGLLSSATVLSMHLTGLGSEETLFLRFGTFDVKFQGLLLAGILLGVLGVLDDICLSQVAVVEELWQAKPNIEFRELIQRSLRVGKTHVASLVNTLVLAYAGANLPLFLLFHMNQQPLWVTINSEVLMEEIVRTLAGSIGLVLAVPICTFIAAAGLLFLPTILPFSFQPEKKNTHHHH